MPRVYVALILAFTLFVAGASCHPPDTRVVVFLQGYYTSLDASGTAATGLEDHTFETIKARLLDRGYASHRLLDYSYNGGSVDGAGTWSPAPFSCGDTDRRADDALAALERMLGDYRRKHADVHFALVGHSLGGYVAFLEGAREAARPEDERLDIDVVVTLDAPLRGVDADKKIILDNFVPCTVKTYVAGAEVVAAKLDPATPHTRAAQAAAMADAGIRLATLGNTNDCLYNLPLCLGPSFVDDSATQFLEGEAAVSTAYAIASHPLLSHVAVLADPAVAQDVVTFVGAP